MSAKLTLERLREVLHYDPDTGVFTWAVDRGYRTKAGDRAGTINGTGYAQISIVWRVYQAHRLAWEWVTGVRPAALVDHINGVRSDNRWGNLRECTYSQNAQNKSARVVKIVDSPLGVSWNLRRKCWVAQIRLGEVHKHLGKFPTAEAAHQAYLAEKKHLHTFQPVPRYA